ncbi:MAG TPA: M4 family metallopeptidase [Streptomyces sp.]|nr:M4 family metallopeptidase [Streptomyces sp.]
MRSVRAVSAAGTLTLVLGLCIWTPTSLATATGAETGTDATSGTSGSAEEAAERRLRADAVDPVVVRTGSDGEAEFVGTLGAPVAAPTALPATATPTRAAEQHLDRYGALFGVHRPEAQLERTDVVATGAGSHVVRFTQTVDGLPVIGGELAVSVDDDGDLESVNGETTDPAVLPAAMVSAKAAIDTAVRTTSRTHGAPVRNLAAGSATRWYYDPQLVGSPDPVGARPVWRVEVTNGSDIREMVLVDSATGGVAAHVNQTSAAKIRVVCDREELDESDAPCRRGAYARTETSAPAGEAEVDRAFLFAGHTWDLYRRLGRDLTAMIGHNAGDGRKLRLTANLTGNNAFWNGREAFFSRGWSLADDVVAHELSHGVVQHTAGLMNWYQSGAIDESMADVFGEIVDQRNGTDRPGQPNQRNWLLGEDAPGGTLRDMRSPSRLLPGMPRQPDRMRSRFYAADARINDNGGVHINSGVGNKAAVLIAEGGRFNGLRVRGIDAGRATRIKTARIYLRVLPMLTSGSDYADLGRLLPQACRLVGRGQPAITRADCVQVRRAVRATQMHLQPRRAQAPAAPRCTPRQARTQRLFFDNMERNRSRLWRFGPLWGRVPGVQPTQYATSGRRSVFGRDPNPAAGERRQGSLTLRQGIRVRDGRRTFLRFEHARLFEYNFRSGPGARYFDGGRVEYSLNRGRTWHNSAGLSWVNGPRQRITAQRTGFRGFGGDSHGYMSSRLNLSRFAGRTMHLRWTISADPTVAFRGWWLDDIDVYTCRRRT